MLGLQRTPISLNGRPDEKNHSYGSPYRVGGLKVEDRTRYRAAVIAGAQTGWGYYFPYLLLQDKPGRSTMLIAEDGGSLCVFRWKLVPKALRTNQPV